jgi:hypothetical protein
MSAWTEVRDGVAAHAKANPKAYAIAAAVVFAFVLGAILF